jgi:hypothetical protein
VFLFPAKGLKSMPFLSKVCTQAKRYLEVLLEFSAVARSVHPVFFVQLEDQFSAVVHEQLLVVRGIVGREEHLVLGGELVSGRYWRVQDGQVELVLFECLD